MSNLQIAIHIGKSETAFNLRFNNHRNHIKRGIISCKLSGHFLHNSRSHDFSKDVTITIIEQIKPSNMTIEQKKEILRGREIFWQSRLNALQPNGLNKRMGFRSESNIPLQSIQYINNVLERKLIKVIPLYAHTNVINLLEHNRSQLIK